jgi:hypothetical protein
LINFIPYYTHVSGVSLELGYLHVIWSTDFAISMHVWICGQPPMASLVTSNQSSLLTKTDHCAKEQLLAIYIVQTFQLPLSAFEII